MNQPPAPSQTTPRPTGPSALWTRLDQLGADCLPNTNAVTQTVCQLISPRFPFTQASVDRQYVQQIQQVLENLPKGVIAYLAAHQVKVIIDLVCEIPAVFDVSTKTLYLSQLFVNAENLFHSNNNPVYPYGLTAMLTHEIGHFLDWYLWPQSALSHTKTYETAFRRDLQAIPRDFILSYTDWQALTHGNPDTGQAGQPVYELSPDKRLQNDVSLFCYEPEETWSDCTAALLCGEARPAIYQYFPQTLKTVEYLISHHSQQMLPKVLTDYQGTQSGEKSNSDDNPAP